MPFGIPKDGFWGTKELSYQHVHMFWAFWVGFLVYSVSGNIITPVMCGALCGLAMETYQARDGMGSWIDAARDLAFWTLGGCLNYIIIFVRA